MKINNKTEAAFLDVGTVVAYEKRTFYLEGELWKKGIEDLKKIGSIYKIYYPSTQVSDLVDISLYNFDFNLSAEKEYVPNFYPGLLDDFSIDLLGPELDIFSSRMIPQLSNQEVHQGPTYFGGFQTTDGNYVKLLKIPENYWKVEIYNEKNLTYNTDGDIFMDYDIIQKSNLNSYYTPSIQIYFGPLYDTRISGISFDNLPKIYKDRYLQELSDEEYESFPNVMTLPEYIKSFRNEVLTDKILYLVYNGSGEVLKVDIVNESFKNSINPGRNQHKLSMRMDDYLEHSFSPIEKKGTLVLDKNSGVLLGNRKANFRIFESRKRRATQTNRGTNSKKIEADGKTYLNGNPQHLWQNPVISPDWVIDREINSPYHECVVYVSGKGTVTDNTGKKICGQLYLKEGKELSLTPQSNTGWVLLDGNYTTPDTKRGDSFIYSNCPERIDFVFTEVEIPISISLVCEKDYVRNSVNPPKSTYNIGSNSFSGLKTTIFYRGEIYSDKDISQIAIKDGESIDYFIELGDLYRYEGNSYIQGTMSFENSEILIVNNNKTAQKSFEIEVIRPTINLSGTVEFSEMEDDEMSGNLRVYNYGSDVSIIFFSYDPIFKDKTEAKSCIKVQDLLGNDVPYAYEIIEGKTNYYKIKIYGIVKDLNITVGPIL